MRVCTFLLRMPRSRGSSVAAAVGLCGWNPALEPMAMEARPRAGKGREASVGTRSLGWERCTSQRLLLDVDIQNNALRETMLQRNVSPVSEGSPCLRVRGPRSKTPLFRAVLSNVPLGLV